jgi:hypothetical protein
MGRIRCPETSVINYHTTLRNISGECSAKDKISYTCWESNPVFPVPSLVLFWRRRPVSCLYMTVVLDILDEDSQQNNYCYCYILQCSCLDDNQHSINFQILYLKLRCEYFKSFYGCECFAMLSWWSAPRWQALWMEQIIPRYSGNVIGGDLRFLCSWGSVTSAIDRAQMRFRCLIQPRKFAVHNKRFSRELTSILQVKELNQTSKQFLWFFTLTDKYWRHSKWS